jgi:hypothetical protein
MLANYAAIAIDSTPILLRIHTFPFPLHNVF